MKGTKRGLLLMLVPLFVITYIFLWRDSQNISDVRGVILPHHLVAGDILTEVLKTVDARKIKRIILIGPNHGERGAYTALAAGVDWEIGGERFVLDKELFVKLQREGFIQRNDDAIMGEHAVTVPISYIQEAIPNVKILPIMLSENQSIERLKELGQRLAPDEETLIVASIDFSHYLPLDQANKNDEVTNALIASWDYAGLYELNSDYIDSSSSIIVFLTAMDAVGATDGRVINHSNSALILDASYEYTTSYFTMIFR